MRRQSVWTEAEMFSHMIERAEHRHEKHEHFVIERFPSLVDLTENTILGSFSWSGLQSKKRWLAASNVVHVGGFASTPGDIARDYLSAKYAKRNPITADQKHEVMKPRHHPLKAVPGYYKHAVYIDVRAAFWSIMSIVGWDVDYFPERWLSSGETMEDFPYAGHKLVRNILATCGLLGKIRIWSFDHQRVYSKSAGNRFINYQLWSIIQDTLNGVAHDMQEISLYVHTDGYIVHKADEERARAIIRSWGLSSRRKMEGDCLIHSAGQYRFNQDIARPPAGSPKELAGVYYPIDTNWLRRRLSKLAKLANPPIAPDA